MAIILIGGNSRRVGKTSVVAGIIANLPEYGWSAFEIAQHGHGMGSVDASASTGWAMSEETDRSGKSDTSRFQAAGAERAFWVRTEPNRLDQAMPAVQDKLAESKNAIVESNSVLQFLQPDLYLVVIDPAVHDSKTSAQKFLDRADAMIVHHRPSPAHEEWFTTLSKLKTGRPVFLITSPKYVTREIVEFVRKALSSQDAAGGR